MPHWSDQKEAAGRVWQMRLVFRLSRSLPGAALSLILRIVVLVFFLIVPEARRVSRKFLKAVADVAGRPAPRTRHVLRHLFCFARSLLEKAAAWAGEIKAADLAFTGPDIDSIWAELSAGHGAVILCSHLGNTEMLRALASREAGKSLPAFRINSIVDFSGTEKFNRLLREINPDSMVRLYHASSVGADTVIELADRLGKGELIVIAADRTAARNRGRTGRVSFLGREAHFPLGAFVLAGLFDAPIYHMFAVRRNDLDFKSPYEFHLHRSRLVFDGPRRKRMETVDALMKEYVGLLERLCLTHPYQWYNFFDFWAVPR